MTRVRLDGPKVWKTRSHGLDASDATQVELYRCSTTAPWVDMQPRFGSVLGLWDWLHRDGVSLCFHLQFSIVGSFCDGLVRPVTPADLDWISHLVCGCFDQQLSETHARGSLGSPLPFKFDPVLTPDDSGIWSDPVMIDQAFQKLCFRTSPVWSEVMLTFVALRES